MNACRETIAVLKQTRRMAEIGGRWIFRVDSDDMRLRSLIENPDCVYFQIPCKRVTGL